MGMKSSSLLNYITSSYVRKDTLYRLLEEPLSLAELRGLFNLSSSYLIPRLKELEKENLICRDDGKYRLTFIGETFAKKLRETDGLFGLLEGHAKFFNDHDLSPFSE